jgi:UDP:flavonoid glycosyltransferase YjiC (YdhE family)
MAWPSHYYPMVPLAWALRAAGHDVRVAGQPPVVQPVLTSGLVAVPAGASYDLMAGIAELNEAVKAAQGSMPTSVEDMRALPPGVLRGFRDAQMLPHVSAAAAMADDLIAATRSWRPDLIVADPVTLVAPLLADVLGCPLVHHLWGPFMPGLNHFPGLGGDPADWPADLRALFERYGAGPRARHAVATVDPCPAGLQSDGVPNPIPVRYVPYNGPGTAPDWLNEPPRAPRVCVSWSMSNSRAVGSDGFQVPAIVAALRPLDVELVVTVKASDRAALGTPPDGVRFLAELPLNVVLPGCAAAVHHAGAGTLLTAVVYGVPQVMVTPMPDQTFNAERLAAVGAGVALKADRLEPDDLTAAVSAVLTDDGWAQAADRLRAENDSRPTPADAVATLEQLT